jgi:hypothetical protein
LPLLTEERVFILLERDFALLVFGRAERALGLAERALVFFLLRALAWPDLLALERVAFPGRIALTARFAKGAAAWAVFATALAPRAA